MDNVKLVEYVIRKRAHYVLYVKRILFKLFLLLLLLLGWICLSSWSAVYFSEFTTLYMYRVTLTFLFSYSDFYCVLFCAARVYTNVYRIDNILNFTETFLRLSFFFPSKCFLNTILYDPNLQIQTRKYYFCCD